MTTITNAPAVALTAMQESVARSFPEQGAATLTDIARFTELTNKQVHGVVNGLVNALIFARGSYSMATWVAGSVVKSWPGTVIQLVFIPSIVFALMKARLIPERYPKEVPADD